MFQKIGQIVKPTFMADGSMRLIIECGEPTPEEVGSVINLMRKNLVITLVTEEEYNESQGMV